MGEQWMELPPIPMTRKARRKNEVDGEDIVAGVALLPDGYLMDAGRQLVACHSASHTVVRDA